MIHVCFGIHDRNGRYSKFAGATMASIFENTNFPVTIHILHDATLTDENRDKFSYLAGRYGQHVNFHNVEKLCAEEINFLREKLADKIKLRFSIGAFYRLLIKKILAPKKIGKAIYLDADIIVNLDINELWQHDLKNFPLAAVPEQEATLDDMIINKFLLNTNKVAKENYFCSGVILFNLDALDENFFRDGVQFLVDNPKCESPDQDILNAFFAADYLKLEQKFDSFSLAERQRKFPVKRKIYHYAGQCLELKLDDAYNRLFMKYFALTPWFDVDALARIGDTFRTSNDQFTLSVQMLMDHCVHHSRAFFVGSNNLSAMKMLFHVQEGEPVIESRDSKSIDELIAKMHELHGKTLFIICRGNYLQIKRKLVGEGFKEYADFINGLSFMTREQCGYTRPEWAMIRDM